MLNTRDSGVCRAKNPRYIKYGTEEAAYLSRVDVGVCPASESHNWRLKEHNLIRVSPTTLVHYTSIGGSHHSATWVQNQSVNGTGPDTQHTGLVK